MGEEDWMFDVAGLAFHFVHLLLTKVSFRGSYRGRATAESSQALHGLAVSSCEDKDMKRLIMVYTFSRKLAAASWSCPCFSK